jgi:hypothetical protein
MTFKSFIFITIFFMLSCNTKQSTENKLAIVSASFENNRQQDFRKFLEKFKILNLPLTINTLGLSTEKYAIISVRDSIFLRTYPDDFLFEEIRAYGLLPDTLNSFKVIWLKPADISFPVLTTFTKNGKRINEEVLSIGECGSDCCYTCKETIRINTDLSLYCADSIRSCKCDSLGPKDETMEKFVLYKTGKITQNGKIIISKLIRKKE